MVHVIAYDLHNPGRDYDDIAELIKTASGGWAHPQGSVWFVDSLKSPAWWRDQLKQAGDSNDEFFVARWGGNWASYNQDPEINDWLNDTRRRW